MAGLIQKYKSTISSKIRQFCSGRKLDKPKHYLLVRQNDELNYKLIKYIWWKNFHIEVKNAQLEKNHSSVKSNYDTYTEQSCWIQTTEFKDNDKLRNTLLKKIATQPKKKYINKSLKTLNAYGMLCCKYQHPLNDDQQNSVSDCIKQSLNVILNQGKLKKTKITDQKADRLIRKNKEVLKKIAKIEIKNENYQSKSDLWIRRIIFEEIKQRRIQQFPEELKEVRSIMRNNAKECKKLMKSTKVLLGTTKNTTKEAKNFSGIAKEINHKTASNKIFYYALAVVAAIIVTALICYCIYTTFSKPSQSLDNVALMQNMGKLINSIT